MAKSQLTAEEVIAEIRSIADAMAIRDIEPGFISPSMKYRANDLLLRAGIPLGPWADHRQYLTKPGTVTLNGSPVTMQVHKAVIDDTAGEICRAIVGCLNLVDWKIHPEYVDWTPDRAEAAIREAAKELPELCDRLELETGIKPPYNVREQYAGGTQKKNSGKNNHAWDANAKKMATRYIAACKKDGKRFNRLDFIKEELLSNADDFPNAREASTINQSLKIHSSKWKPRLDKALGKTTEAE